LANHKSALKRARQNEVKRIRNKSLKTSVKNIVKEVRAAVAENSVDEAREALTKAVSIIQKTSAKKILHKKQASRKISRLTLKVNQMTANSPGDQ